MVWIPYGEPRQRSQLQRYSRREIPTPFVQSPGAPLLPHHLQRGEPEGVAICPNPDISHLVGLRHSYTTYNIAFASPTSTSSSRDHEHVNTRMECIPQSRHPRNFYFHSWHRSVVAFDPHLATFAKLVSC